MAGLEKAGVILIAQDAAGFFGDMHKASAAVNTFSGDVESAAGRTSGAGQIMTGALRQVGAFAVTAFLEAGRAAVGFAKDSIDAAGDFEQGMNKFTAVAGGALDEAGLKTKDFKDLFITLGKELPVSTSEVQQAAIEMVKGGIDPATVAAGGLRQVIQFAAAADMDLAQASTIAAKALGGWVDITASATEKSAFLSHSTDLLSKAANASTVEVSDLALGLYNVQGTAKLAGVSFDETVTSLAQLAPSFSSSADAGTSFKTFLARLLPTTDNAISAMDGLGLYTEKTGSVFYDANGKFVGMAKASELLKQSLVGLTDAQKQQALQTIFGQDAIRVAAVLSEQGAAGFDAMAASMAKQMDVAEMAKTKQAGFNTAMENFKGSVEALQITIGSLLLPVLTDLFNNYLAPGINTLTTLASALSGDNAAFAQLSPTMQGVAVTIQQLWADLSAVADVAIPALVGAWDALQPALETVQGLFASTGESATGMGSTMQAVVDTVIALVSAYAEVVGAELEVVTQFWQAHGEEIAAFAQSAWAQIEEIISSAMQLIQATVVPALQGIASFIQAHGADIQSILGGAWQMVSSIISGALTLISGLIHATLQAIQGDWSGAWSTIQSTSASFVSSIGSAIMGFLNMIAGFFGTTLRGIADTWSSNWNNMVSLVTGAVSNIVSVIMALPGQVVGVGEAIVNNIWNGLRAKWEEMLAWWNAQLQSLQDTLTGSEPKDPSSPLRGLAKRGAAIVENLQAGMNSAGPLNINGLVSSSASPSALMRGGSTTTNSSTYSPTINYAPTYGRAPRAPAMDIAAMTAWGI